MKKAFFTLLMLTMGIVAFAQNATSSLSGENTGQKYITNRFWDNWFISVGAGAQVYLGESDDLVRFGKRMTPAFDLSVGKWITPAVGFRAQLYGFNLRGFTYKSNLPYIVGMEGSLYKQEWDFLNVHGDVLFNLSNILGKYRTDRFYEIVPYVGFGALTTINEDQNDKDISLNAGIINKFRLSDAVDLNLEIRGALVPESFDGHSLIRASEGMAGATVGITYKFRDRAFKPYHEPIPAEPQLISAEDLERLRQQVAAAQNRTGQLQNELNAEKSKPKGVVTEKDLVAIPLAVFFDINKSVIKSKEKINLGFIADVIKQYPSEKFTITGHADKATGNADYNQKLSEQRAQAVADMLVNEFGVNRNQLVVKGVGDTQNTLPTPPLNRVVILRQ